MRLRKGDTTLLTIIILVLLGVTIYSNTFFSSFHFDDDSFIVGNGAIRNLGNPLNIWNFWPTRFVSFLTFALNYRFHQLHLFGYHLINFIIHLGSSVLIYWFMLLSFLTPEIKKSSISRHSTFLALFGALVFLSHPIQTQSVTYISQRMTSLVGFFYLFSVCLYVKSRLLQINLSPASSWRWPYFSSLACGLISMFTKENAVTLPLIIILCEACFFTSGRHSKYKYALIFLAMLPIIPMIVFLSRSPSFTDIQRLFTQPISAGHYFLTQLRVMLTYIRLLFIPLNQNLDYDYSISKTLLDFPTLASLILLLIIIFIAIRLLPKYRLISFAIFWFFITLLLESSIIPLRHVIFEHWLYLPMVGYSFFIVSGAYYLFRNKTLKTVAVAFFLIICYSSLTYQRNKVWRDELTLWTDVLNKSSAKAGPYINRAIAFINRREYDKAIADLNQALQINSNYAEAYNNRAIAFINRREYDKAIADLNQALRIEPHSLTAYMNLAKTYAAIGKNQEALTLYKKLIKLDPYCWEGYNNIAVIYGNLGRHKQAIILFKEAIKIMPDYLEAHSNLCSAYGNLGNFKEAIVYGEKAVALEPSSALAHINLSAAYFYAKKYDLAIKHCDKAIKLGHEVCPMFLKDLKPHRK